MVRLLIINYVTRPLKAILSNFHNKIPKHDHTAFTISSTIIIVLNVNSCRVDTHLDNKSSVLPDYITRTTGALNKIAEEHWRRQMQQELEEEKKRDLNP